VFVYDISFSLSKEIDQRVRRPQTIASSFSSLSPYLTSSVSAHTPPRAPARDAPQLIYTQKPIRLLTLHQPTAPLQICHQTRSKSSTSGAAIAAGWQAWQLRFHVVPISTANTLSVSTAHTRLLSIKTRRRLLEVFLFILIVDSSTRWLFKRKYIYRMPEMVSTGRCCMNSRFRGRDLDGVYWVPFC